MLHLLSLFLSLYSLSSIQEKANNGKEESEINMKVLETPRFIH